jgi:hypothetical protein
MVSGRGGGRGASEWGHNDMGKKVNTAHTSIFIKIDSPKMTASVERESSTHKDITLELKKT